MALTQHEQVVDATKAMETSIYGALDAIDNYRDLVTSLIEKERASDEPNAKLVERYEMFLKKAASMTSSIEDDVIDELLYCLHRLFAVDLAERNEFI